MIAEKRQGPGCCLGKPLPAEFGRNHCSRGGRHKGNREGDHGGYNGSSDGHSLLPRGDWGVASET